MNQELVKMIEDCGLEVEDVAHIIEAAQQQVSYVSEQDALIQRMFDAGFFGALDYDSAMESLMDEGVFDELYYCECDNCGNCCQVVKVGSRCNSCKEGIMHP
ncbi:hypothetical protein J0J26_20610 [Vibrio vulnificus]|uniref:hypothetical protein n=1 Tax=Vibrio vulnificus TaxID=672 RepID=UPI0019D439F6|nr:hypothetical protein [Vibrio vulnificus]MBN8090479.1 hypothetical protein [Vibrio vulnificus]MBN8119336.1 hypothetical protein [Vibrio vulnificus]